MICVYSALKQQPIHLRIYTQSLTNLKILKLPLATAPRSTPLKVRLEFTLNMFINKSAFSSTCVYFLCIFLCAGNSEGTISIKEGELLTVMEEDKGDGWMRVLKATGEEGYIPSSYAQVASQLT